jgi:hypothetical protein
MLLYSTRPILSPSTTQSKGGMPTDKRASIASPRRFASHTLKGALPAPIQALVEVLCTSCAKRAQPRTKKPYIYLWLASAPRSALGRVTVAVWWPPPGSPFPPFASYDTPLGPDLATPRRPVTKKKTRAHRRLATSREMQSWSYKMGAQYSAGGSTATFCIARYLVSPFFSNGHFAGQTISDPRLPSLEPLLPVRSQKRP